jgi:hypothetical protein
MLQVSLPEVNESFCLIYSIEDPYGNSPIAGTGVQVCPQQNSQSCHTWLAVTAARGTTQH